MADLDLAAGHHTIDRGADDGTIEIDARLVACGACGKDLRIILRRCPVDQRAIGVTAADRGGAVRGRLSAPGVSILSRASAVL
ncbi:hypothetical protein [Sphingopyxis sp.]|uniref:hypothetical protein n=1 Tax=Sphingopyxis sp. TaxID=1908224 RepID=UPI0025D7180B|nr:hypothetical protein [Sphingopyxis sp.]